MTLDTTQIRSRFNHLLEDYRVGYLIHPARIDVPALCDEIDAQAKRIAELESIIRAYWGAVLHFESGEDLGPADLEAIGRSRDEFEALAVALTSK